MNRKLMLDMQMHCINIVDRVLEGEGALEKETFCRVSNDPRVIDQHLFQELNYVDDDYKRIMQNKCSQIRPSLDFSPFCC